MLRHLTVQVFLAAALAVLLALGYLALGLSLGWVEESASLIKQVFIGLLRMLVVPMIFFSLIGGVVSIGNVLLLRRLGGATVLYYLGTTGIATGMALAAVFLYHPWTDYPPLMAGFAVAPGSAAAPALLEAGQDSLLAVLGKIAGQALVNPFTALAEMNILGIVTSALLIGIAMALLLDSESALVKGVQQANQVIFKILGWVIRLLPIGIFAILFEFTLRLSGTGGHAEAFLAQLFSFGALVVGLTLAHGLLALPLIAWALGGMPPAALLRKVAQPLLVAFSSSSSAATLPVSMRCAKEELQVSDSVGSFVLPLGATINMDGTALFEAMAAIFLAYLYGLELSAVMVATVFFMAMVASIGAPGMPTASMSGMQMVMLAIGIPLEAIAILLVIERPLDTVRTAVNVEGDLVGSLVVQRYMGARGPSASA